MAEEIRGDQIFEPGYLDRAKKEADDLLYAFGVLELQLKEILKVSKGKLSIAPDPKTISDLEKQSKLIADVAKAEKNLLDIEKKTAEAQRAKLSAQTQAERLQQAQIATTQKKIAVEKAAETQARKNIEAEKNKVGIINQLKEELKQVTVEWNRTTDAEQLDINVTGSLAQRKKILTENLKRLEEATGDHRRSVGNYSKELKGLNIVLDFIEKTTGLNLSAFRNFGAGLKVVASIARVTGLSMAASFAIATLGISALITGITFLISRLKDTGEETEKLKEKEKALKEQRQADERYYNEYYNSSTEKEIALAKVRGASATEIFLLEKKLINDKIKQNEEAINAMTDISTEEYRERTLASKKLNTDLLLLEENHTKNLKDEAVKRKEELKEIEKKNFEELKKFREDIFNAQTTGISDLFKKEEADLLKRRTSGLISEQAYQAELYELRRSQIEINFKRGIILEGEYLLQIANLEKGYSDFLKSENKKRLSEQEKYEDERLKLSEKAEALRQKSIDREKEANREILEDAKKLQDELFNLSKDKIGLQKQVNDDRLKDIDAQIQQQQQLMIAGEKNTLAFLQRERAKALEERVALEKKERRRLEAEKTFEIFLAFMKEFAKDGFAGIGKAIQATLFAKSAGKAVAAFAKGTAKVEGGEQGKDSVPALLMPGEAVVTAKQNAAAPGLAEAWNAGRLREFITTNYFPKIYADKSRRENFNDAGNSLLNNLLDKKIDALIEVIKNKQEFQIGDTIEGDIYTVIKKNGVSHETIHKNLPVIVHPKHFRK